MWLNGTGRHDAVHPIHVGQRGESDRAVLRRCVAEDRVIVEIHERSWLKSAPQDIMDQRTCAVLRFRGEQICEMRDYTDSHIYEEFLKRHKADLPKFRSK